jgi:4-carboxymuconolactone decarboxylase
MARLPYPDLKRSPERVRAVLAGAPPLHLFWMLAHAETAFEPAMQLGGAILAHLRLDPKLRELAILGVATQAQARYEWVQHVEIGRTAGIRDDQIEAIERGATQDSTAFSELERAVLAFTTEVLAGPTVSGATFAAVDESLSPREIVELLLTIGNYLMLARVMTTLEIDIDEAAGNAVVGAATDEQLDERARR